MTGVRSTCALLWLIGCGAAPPDDGVDDTDSPPIGPGERWVEATLFVQDHDILDEYGFTSSTPAMNRYSDDSLTGYFMLQLAFVSDGAEPTIGVNLNVVSFEEVPGPGTYPFVSSALDEAASEDAAVGTLTWAQNAEPQFSATAIPYQGTITFNRIEGGRAEGSFDMTGPISWHFGEGFPEFALSGSFGEVPVIDI